jgi:hypothetical protein
MNAHQKKVFDEVPGMYQVHYAKAYAGTSRKASITAFCLHCVGNSRADITNCTSWACPLHPVRPYQRAENVADNALETIGGAGVAPEHSQGEPA